MCIINSEVSGTKRAVESREFLRILLHVVSSFEYESRWLVLNTINFICCTMHHCDNGRIKTD